MPEQPTHEPVIEVARTDVEQFLSKFLVRVTEDDEHLEPFGHAVRRRLGPAGHRLSLT